MSATASTSVSAQSDLRQWTLCALVSLGMQPEPDNEEAYRAVLPENLQENEELRALCPGSDLVFTFSGHGDAPEGAIPLTLDSPLFAWLHEQVQAAGGVLHAQPATQPASVSEITPHLFEPYRVEGGRVQLGGCRLEDRPILKFIYRLDASPERDDAEDRLVHLFAMPDGAAVDSELVAALGLEQLVPYSGRLPILTAEQRELLSEEGQRQAAQLGQISKTAQLMSATIVWCKYVVGKLTFIVGESKAEVNCEGWARLLAEGRLKPPPFKCPESSLESYHLAITDDGLVTVSEALATCAGSGRRGLAVQMRPSALSGKLALPEGLVRCPVSGEEVLESELVTCPMCGQSLAPSALRGNRCLACRRLSSVSKDDPRMARALGEYPGLDHWRRWKIAETDRAYILQAVGLVRQLVIVLDKDSLEVLRAAEGHRLLGSWQELPQVEQQELLG